MTTLRHSAPDLAAFEEAAARFAATLRAGDVVVLEGELGAGKTTFVAAVVRALHGPGADVSSPTFTFWNRYPGTPQIEHLDLYRIEEPSEATELGLHEALVPDGITFIEWPQRLPELVPARAVRVSIAGGGEDPRTLTIERP